MADAPKPLSDLLTEWDNAKKQLDYFSNLENSLRKQIFNQEFPSPERGTNKKRIEHDMALVGDYRLNYKIDRAGLEATLQGLSQDSNERAIIEGIISYSPKVKEAAFEALDDEGKKLVGPFITVTPGTPGIEIKPQNKVRW